MKYMPHFLLFNNRKLISIALAGNKAASIPYLEPSEFALDFDIEAKMSPGIKVVIYYIRDDGEIVADSISLKVWFLRPC